ncbi:MAG: penicillin-binding protein activator [Thiogranum sp.]|nr:penicillin-binding protein activator [Thiogranum sp.]
MHPGYDAFTIAARQNEVIFLIFVNRLYPWLLIVLLALASCTGAPPRGPQPVLDPLQQSAQTLVERGDHLAAAQIYLDAAQTAPADQRPDLHLQAAEYLAQGQLWEQFGDLLASLRRETLTTEQQAHLQLLLAQRALALGKPAQALEHLQVVAQPDQLPDHGRRYYRLRASAYSAAGNPLEAARQLIWLDGLLDDPQQQLDNQYLIWEQLSSLSDQALREILTATSSDALRGWMELTLIARQTRGDRQQWERRLDDWRARYPQHAAERALLPDLATQLVQPGERAVHIGVLLPLSGRNAESAAAIRDGIIAAYYADALQRPELRFYDTGGNPLQVWGVYQNAIRNGAEIIIGPLLKESVAQLAAAGELTIPVLALNALENPPPPDLPLYQFGLSPEDEAGQVANRMFSEGHRAAVALAPDTPWGARVTAAFAEHFSGLEGQLLESQYYAPGSTDFRTPIQDALNLDSSVARHRALQRQLGQNLHFEPRRRQDVDAIFMLGSAEQARQISPQLKFHHAGDLPVFGTSHLFSTSGGQQLDRDINGVFFCDMPWILDSDGDWFAQRRRIAAIWPERDERNPRLFALGIDSYRVLPWLATLDRPGLAHFPGATGLISIDSARQLHRSLEWAQIRNGKPHKLVSTPETLSMEGQNESAQDTRRQR